MEKTFQKGAGTYSEKQDDSEERWRCCFYFPEGFQQQLEEKGY